jgi:hypothetical protein
VVKTTYIFPELAVTAEGSALPLYSPIKGALALVPLYTRTKSKSSSVEKLVKVSVTDVAPLGLIRHEQFSSSPYSLLPLPSLKLLLQAVRLVVPEHPPPPPPPVEQE